MPDNNIVNVAIPTIQHSLHLSVAGLEWVVSSYLLTLAGLLLVGGRLADVYGRRRLFQAGLAIFTLSSLAAGLAGSGGVLIGSRAVQGAGAALLMPATLAIIVDAFRDMRERNMAIGIWAAVGALALATGPVLGGLISQHIRWGWIFLINVPVGVITFVLTQRGVTESRADSTVRRLDLPGLVTSAVTLFALTYALIEGNVRGWTSPLILGAFALSAVAVAVFLAIEARVAHPMVELAMFRRREFSGGTGTMMIWAFGILGIYFFTSLYLQETLGFSPVKAGLAFVPMALLVAVTPPVRAGVASALLNASREVAGLLGITVIGAVLSTRRAAALRSGASPVHAFLDGYHTGLLVTIVLLAAGVVVSYLTLRPRRSGLAAEPTVAITAAGEIEAIGEMVAPDPF